MLITSHGYHGFTSLCSRPLLNNRRQSVGMLWRVSEKAETGAVFPVGSHCCLWSLGGVTWWAINHVGVDSTQLM